MNVNVLLHHLLTFILIIYGDNSLCRKVCQIVIQYIKDYVSNIFLPSLKKDVLDALKNPDPKQRIMLIEKSFSAHTEIFNYVDTEKKRFKLLKRKGLTAFQLYPIGTHFISKISNNELSWVAEKLYGINLPLRQTLKLFMQIPGMFQQVYTYMKNLETENDIISNITQGELWKTEYQKKFSDRIVFPLNIFYDDFEGGNPLGSKAGKNKFGVVYAMIACLPPNLASRLSSIFFVNIVHTEEKKNVRIKMYSQQ